MRAVVVFESLYGNTAAIGQVVASSLPQPGVRGDGGIRLDDAAGGDR